MVVVRHLGLTAYEPVLAEMRAFTETRGPQTPDEIWLLEHHSVFTLGQAGKAHHILRPLYPIVQTDRGGQVTYHGPGQLVVYILCDLQRCQLKLRALIAGLHQSIITVLDHYGIASHLRSGAPGVYVQEEKIAALGLRVSRGCSYHGISLNVAMDLEPFNAIHPCGYTDLKVTQMANYVAGCTVADVAASVCQQILPLIEKDKT